MRKATNLCIEKDERKRDKIENLRWVLTSCNTLEEKDETSFKLQKITRNTTVSESFSADTSNDADTEEMDLEEVQPDMEDDIGQVDLVDDEEDGK